MAGVNRTTVGSVVLSERPGASRAWLGACAALVWLAASTASALAFDWTITSVRGTAFYLEGDRWVELAEGEHISEITLRTLRTGRVTLVGSDGTGIQIGASSAIQVFAAPEVPTLRQFIGTIAVSLPSHEPTRVDLQVGQLRITSLSGDLVVAMAGPTIKVSVVGGGASASVANGPNFVFPAGTYVADADTSKLALVATGRGSGGSGLTQNSAANATTAVANNGSGNSGNSGSGNSGNGNSSNNGNGNSGNGGSNGNSGNNGNGNGGGGNSNSSNGGNGNSGNSGNGNSGNGNGNNGNGNSGNGNNGNGKGNGG